MNILIITTYYPPDTTIAAVRPYMYAKYLSQLGHTVTVLRSGLIHETADRFFEETPDVRVVSFLGKNAPSERYERGEIAAPKKHQRHNRLLRAVAKVFRSMVAVLKKSTQKNLQSEMEKNLSLQKACIDRMATENEHFDVVFATYSNMENAYAGEYASKIFNCKWIMDFRDPMAQKNSQSPEIYKKNKETQNYFIEKADLITSVAEDSLEDMCRGLSVAKRAVLYNGFEALEKKQENSNLNHFTLCYTGQVYKMRMDAIIVFLKSINVLLENGVIEKSKIKVYLAGQNVHLIIEEARKMGIADIFLDCGYVNREKASEIQTHSDIFLLFNWNTAYERGGITGKFYEGIRAQKPILSLIAGTVPNSELFRMNEKYHYGFCYECCRENQFDALCKYIEQAYRQKMEEGAVRYKPSPRLYEDFRYDALAKKFSDLCEQLA